MGSIVHSDGRPAGLERGNQNLLRLLMTAIDGKTCRDARDCAIVLLRSTGGLPFHEIGLIVGLSPGGVHRRFHRTLARARTKNLGAGPDVELCRVD